MHGKLSRKPNCRSYMRFLDSRNSHKRLYITLSRILSILESKDIGRQFEHLSLDSFLKMGMALLDFRIEGKKPCEKEILNSSDNWFEISLLSNFKIFVGILSGPTSFRGLRGATIYLISFIDWLYKKRINFYFRKKIIKFISRKFDCRLNRAWNMYKVFIKCISNVSGFS